MELKLTILNEPGRMVFFKGMSSLGDMAYMKLNYRFINMVGSDIVGPLDNSLFYFRKL